MQMKINHVEIVFDPYDQDHAAAYDKAVEDLSKSEDSLKAARETQKMVEINQAVIDMFRAFFVTATGTDVLAGCRNVQLAYDAYYGFLEEVGRVKSQLLQKYSVKRVR